MIGPTRITEYEKAKAAEQASSLETELSRIEAATGRRVNLIDYLAMKCNGGKGIAVLDDVYDRLLRCTLLHSPFSQKPCMDNLILYIIDPDKKNMGRIAVNLKKRERSNADWDSMPKACAFDPDCDDMFMKEAAQSDANLYIALNPSSRVEVESLIVMVPVELQRRYDNREPRVLLAGEAALVCVPGRPAVGYCWSRKRHGSKAFPDKLVEEALDHHRIYVDHYSLTLH